MYLGKQKKMTQVLDPCHACWRPRWNFCSLTCSGPDTTVATISKVNRCMQNPVSLFSFSLCSSLCLLLTLYSFTQINKYLKKELGPFNSCDCMLFLTIWSCPGFLPHQKVHSILHIAHCQPPANLSESVTHTLPTLIIIPFRVHFLEKWTTCDAIFPGFPRC